MQSYVKWNETMSKPELLIVDDEEEVLNALKRVLRKDYELHLFSEPQAALEFFQSNPVPLVISDMRMPVMDGATFLAKITEISQRSKRFLLTGHADINLTVSAVNDGKISHYFAKPWDNKELMSELKSAYELFISEAKSKKLLRRNIEKNAELSLLNNALELEVDKGKKKLELLSYKEAKSFVRLKRTFSKFIDLNADLISFHTQDNSKHNYRIAAQARLIAQQLNCGKLEVFQIYIAGLLYEIGKLLIPQSLLSVPMEMLTQQERTLYNSFYDEASKLLQKVNELSNIAHIIKHIPEHYNGLGVPDHLSTEEIPLGSRILSVISTFDNLVIGRETQAAISIIEAIHRITKSSKSVFDPCVVKQFVDLLEIMPCASEGTVEYPINVAQLNVGHVLAQNLMNLNQNILLTKDTIIELQHINKLKALELEHNHSFTLFILK